MAVKTDSENLAERETAMHDHTRLRRYARVATQRYALVLAWAGVIALFGVLKGDIFLTTANFSNIFGSQAVLVVVTLGLLVPLSAGDYDLSIASVLTLAAMTLTILNVNYHWPISAAIVVALGAGVAVGLTNGLIVTLLAIDPFIVTLGTGTFVTGIVYWISASNTISGVSNTLVNGIVTDFLGLPLAFYYGLALTAIVWYVFSFTPFGLKLLFVGRGRSVSRLSGVAVGRIRVLAFVSSGFLSAGAGVMYAGTLASADPSSGQTYLLPAFAAAFLGATSIRPGRFNAWGSFVAVYFLVTGITGLQLMGVQTFVQQLFYGSTLVIAVALSRVTQRGETKEAGAIG